MRYFQPIATGVDTLALLLALYRRPELWNAERFRTSYPGTPHGQVDDILLRYSDPGTCEQAGRVMGDERPVWHPAAALLPWQAPVLDLMHRVRAYRLDRCLVTRLRPGGRIARHADDVGPYVNDRDRQRFHLVLQGLPGSLYHCGDETVQMLTGEVWTFDARAEHAVENNSADDRIHLIADLCLLPG